MKMDLKNSLLFPAIQSVHLVGIALLVGATVLIDLEILGFDVARATPPRPRWQWAGLAIMSITGPVLFLADPRRYLNNPAFLLKMVFLLAALVLHSTIHRRRTKAAAVLSIVLWTLVVIGGRAIADFDV
jgi:hypothetical protein